MSLTDFDIGKDHYTAYASLEEANRILAVDPKRKATWAALSDDDKTINLIASTNRLDLMSWRGERTGGAQQTTAFPRTGLVDEDGQDIPEGEIPARLERATALLAGSIAADTKNADPGQAAPAVRRVKAGPAEVEFARSARARDKRPIQDETVFQLIGLWLAAAVDSSAAIGAAAFGTDGESAFADDYRRREGLA